MNLRPATSCCAALAACLSLATSVRAQRDTYSGPPINYMTAEVNDPVARLSQLVASGEAHLEYDAERGYLDAVLQALDVPTSSQTLVFSKTSLQRHRISPRRPRAIYFNDETYVGFCQNGDVLELATTDAKQGAVFYTLEQTTLARPTFVRDQGECLSCHASHRTQDVPGYLIRSVFANASGMPEFGSGTFTTDHTSPLAERWGGWYVTGTHGDMRHMGNAIFDKRAAELDCDAHANLTSLDGLVSTAPYPGEHSDLVALMVLEHQTQMHNAIARANYETRRAMHQAAAMNEALERPPGFLSESSERRIDRAADRVLEYLLFRDEFPLTDPITWSSGFTEEFQARGIRDARGRSLRDFDLTHRLFRYPCSYLIYSEAFQELPDEVRTRVLTRLKGILEGRDLTDAYDHLTPDDREHIKQILNDTLPEFEAVPPRSDP